MPVIGFVLALLAAVAAMLIFGGGIVLVTPDVVAIAGFILLLVTIEMQVRVVEEP